MKSLSYPHWGSPNFYVLLNNNRIYRWSFLIPTGDHRTQSSFDIPIISHGLPFLSPLGITEPLNALSSASVLTSAFLSPLGITELSYIPTLAIPAVAAFLSPLGITEPGVA
jgi:hypothetical protein